MYKLLHISKCADINKNIKPEKFKTKAEAKTFLDTHYIYYLTEQDAYIAYGCAALEHIKAVVNEFISAANGYYVQPCEIEIIKD